MTGLNRSLLDSREANSQALKALKKKVVWFFDDFLNIGDYQRVVEGKKVSDLIYKSVREAIGMSGNRLDLIEEYRRLTGKSPRTISVL